jgi:hypothetical protein
MHPLHLSLKPSRIGWVIYLTDGRQLARFIGPGSRRRALRHITRLTRTHCVR